MKAPILALIIFPLLALASARAADEWQEFRSTEGGFVVLFPGLPKVTDEATDSHGAKSHDFLVDHGDTAYLVGYTDYPANSFAGKPLNKVLDEERDNLVKGTKMTIRADKPISNAGHPGREVVIEDTNGFTQRLSIYLVGDRLYEVISGGPKNHDASPQAKRFHDSFQFIK
jgi:hypothetical protein